MQPGDRIPVEKKWHAYSEKVVHCIVEQVRDGSVYKDQLETGMKVKEKKRQTERYEECPYHHNL